MNTYTKVLFVNDSEEENYLTNLLIEESSLPIKPHFLLDGCLVEEYLESLIPEDFPEIILIDIKMKVMDGFKLYHSLEHSYLKTKPNMEVFFYSASKEVEDMQRLEQLKGVKGFIEKPLDNIKLSKITTPNHY